MQDVVEAAETALDQNSSVCFWLRGMIPSNLVSIPGPPDAVELHDVTYPPIAASGVATHGGSEPPAEVVG
eukprot:8304793-Pyramimonas_sp.AAC.1